MNVLSFMCAHLAVVFFFFLLEWNEDDHDIFFFLMMIGLMLFVHINGCVHVKMGSSLPRHT